MQPKTELVLRGSANLLLIVVGVLLALFAESAWSERGDRAREREILSDLLEEFRSNEARLLSDMEGNAAAFEAEAAWVAAVLNAEPVSSDSLSALFFKARWGDRFYPVTGVLRSVLAGGELGLIRDTQLRAAVAGWLDRAEELPITSQEITGMRASLAPLLLTLEPGSSPSPAMVAAIRYDEAMTTGNAHMMPLLQGIREIISMLEGGRGP